MNKKEYKYKIEYFCLGIWRTSIDTTTRAQRKYFSLEEGIKELNLCFKKETDGYLRRLVEIETGNVIVERCGGCSNCLNLH